MRILLFYPPITIRGDDTTTPGVTPPLGLAYVASYLEKNGHDVKIVDALAEGFSTVLTKHGTTRVGLSVSELKAKISYFNPDVVGISTMFTAFAPDAHELASLVKEILPKTLVVFGGSHASVLSQEILKDKNVDLVVIGEGEETMLEIVNRFEAKKSLAGIKGSAYRDKKGTIVINPSRPFIMDLDSLPFPAYHLLPMDLYLKVTKENKASYDMRSPSTSMFTSRGCPNNCIYCAVPGIWGRRWRPFSSKRILDEIEFLVTRYGVKEIHFLDDNISVVRSRLEQICDGLIERQIDIRWTCPNGIAIWTLDKDLLIKMKKSGCYRLTFGIESGSPTTQTFIRKNLNLQKAKEIMKISSSLGLWTFSTLIIGFPYETKEHMDMTFNYAINSYSDFVAFILLMPFPGTDITKIMTDEKLIKKSDLDRSKIGALFSGYKGLGNKYFTPIELKNFQSNAHKKLLFSRLSWPFTRPLYLIKKIYNWESFIYTLRIINNYLYFFLTTLKLGEFKTHRIKQALKFNLIKT